MPDKPRTAGFYYTQKGETVRERIKRVTIDFTKLDMVYWTGLKMVGGRMHIEGVTKDGANVEYIFDKDSGNKAGAIITKEDICQECIDKHE